MEFREALKKADECSNTMTPMPTYVCHKKVWALKIGEVIPAPRPTIEELEAILNEDPNSEAREVPGAIIVPANGMFAPFPVSRDFVMKHSPEAGGYYVQYKDGYTSFSPAEAFEEGYTRL